MDEEIQYPLDGGAPKHWQIQFAMEACLWFEGCKERWTSTLAQQMYNSLYDNPLEWVQKYLPVAGTRWRKFAKEGSDARPQITHVTKVEVCWGNASSRKCEGKHNFWPPGGKQLHWGKNPDPAFFRNLAERRDEAKDVRFNIHFTAKNHALPDKDKFKKDYGLTLSEWSNEKGDFFSEKGVVAVGDAVVHDHYVRGAHWDPILLHERRTESDGPEGTEVPGSEWSPASAPPLNDPPRTTRDTDVNPEVLNVIMEGYPELGEKRAKELLQNAQSDPKLQLLVEELASEIQHNKAMDDSDSDDDEAVYSDMFRNMTNKQLEIARGQVELGVRPTLPQSQLKPLKQIPDPVPRLRTTDRPIWMNHDPPFKSYRKPEPKPEPEPEPEPKPEPEPEPKPEPEPDDSDDSDDDEEDEGMKAAKAPSPTAEKKAFIDARAAELLADWSWEYTRWGRGSAATWAASEQRLAAEAKAARQAEWEWQEQEQEREREKKEELAGAPVSELYSLSESERGE